MRITYRCTLLTLLYPSPGAGMFVGCFCPNTIKLSVSASLITLLSTLHVQHDGMGWRSSPHPPFRSTLDQETSRRDLAGGRSFICLTNNCSMILHKLKFFRCGGLEGSFVWGK
ncbi:hypothetical protein BX600DRAFT_168063 [Xylariales sp. PMI_506]|nr:hypothetical protein BX600DRAFT_168063 [Xylariales sp. PMI_506]